MTTTVLDQQTGELINEFDGAFDFSLLNDTNTVVLFQIQIRDRGTIILDRFDRDTTNQ